MKIRSAISATTVTMCLALAIAAGAEEQPIDPPNLKVLLSSIDVAVSLIDVYGQCRDEELGHEPCMAMIRSTLGHARTLIPEPQPPVSAAPLAVPIPR